MHKVVIKTDMEIMKKALLEAGFVVNGNKVVVPNGKENQAVEFLENANKNIERQQDYSESISTSNATDIIVMSEEEALVSVDYFEKILKDQYGNDLLVRISVVKQDPLYNEHSRLINITYTSKETGIITTDRVFGYDNSYQFDNEILPKLLDGFVKNSAATSSKLNFIEQSNTKCCLENEEKNQQVFIDGYYVDDVKSILQYESSNELFGNENGYVDVKKLENDGVVENIESYEGFEESYYMDKGYEKSIEEPSKVKKLGEMPTDINNYGFSGWFQLMLFLGIDAVAIGVGLMFLLS